MTTPDEKAWEKRMRKRFETYGPRQNTESAFDYGVVSACADPHPSVLALIEALKFYAQGYNPEQVAIHDAELIPEPVAVFNITALDNLGKADGPFGAFDKPKVKLRAGLIARRALAAWEKRV